MTTTTKEWFEGIAAALTEGKKPDAITARELLARFGAKRRGTHIVETVRSELRSCRLTTEPDFESAWFDEALSFALGDDDAVAADEQPTSGWSRHLQQIASQLERGEQPEPVTVRTMLEWFGAERRGSFITTNIRAALDEFGLRTEPDFRDIYIDSEISFHTAPDASVLPEEKSAPASVREPASAKSDGAAASEPAVETAVPASVEVVAPTLSTPSSPLATPVGISDPTFRIGTLKSANLKAAGKSLIRVSPNDTVAQAVTLMMAHNVSQLPVLQGERDVKGVVTWRSISMYLCLMQGTPNDQVRHCLVSPAQVSTADSYLFAELPRVVEHDYVLIRDAQQVITGIVTPNDLSLQFRDLTEPFLLLGEIENYVRIVVDRGSFTLSELSALQDEGDKRDIKGAADLTLGSLLRLLQDPQNWGRLKLSIDRKSFVEDLDEVRKIRNDVMHFRPDPLPPAKLQTLRRFAHFVQELKRIGAI
jgi:hypothetical protein